MVVLVGVIEEEPDSSLALKLGSLSAMTDNEVVGGTSVGELNLDPSSTWVTVVDFLFSFWLLVFP